MNQINLSLSPETVTHIVEEYLNKHLLNDGQQAKAVSITAVTGEYNATKPSQGLCITFDTVNVK